MTKHHINGAWTVGAREGVLQAVIDNYKFESMREGSHQIAHLLDDTLSLLTTDTIVTHVPTVPAHIRQRSFDHAALLAYRFAKCRKMTHASLLSRVRYASQHELSRAARLEAARYTFIPLRQNIDSPVLLIDDIFTTGATVQACVEQLRGAGAPKIYVAIVARQIPDHKKEPTR